MDFVIIMQKTDEWMGMLQAMTIFLSEVRSGWGQT